MPLYGLTSSKMLSTDEKQQLSNLFTDTHCRIMIAPEQFVHVVFFEGVPLMKNKALYIHANVRLGRSQDQIDRLCESVIKGSAEILGVAKEKIHVNLMEISGKWAMEGGFVMPDPGEEDEWMEKVTAALSEREEVAV